MSYKDLDDSMKSLLEAADFLRKHSKPQGPFKVAVTQQMADMLTDGLSASEKKMAIENTLIIINPNTWI